MTHETTIQHRFRPGCPVYVFNKCAILKTKVNRFHYRAGPKDHKEVTYHVDGVVDSYSEDEVYSTVDEVLQVQREILERSE